MAKSKGNIIVFSNFTKMEGLEIFKIYLKHAGYYDYREQQKDYLCYTEYHGYISKEARKINLKTFNSPDNKLGKNIRVILLGPGGAEGINIYNVRQVHIMDPHWSEIRIEQAIGRAFRQCSHGELPIEDRHVDVYRYKSVRKSEHWTTDQEIEDSSRTKYVLVQSFLMLLKEAAVDCNLNINHNMLSEEYKCFQFPENTLFEAHIKPAYKLDILDDMKTNLNTYTVRVRVIKINAVYVLNKQGTEYSDEFVCLLNPDTNVVYDYDTHMVIGKIKLDEEKLPEKTSVNQYVVNLINLGSL